MKKNVTAAALPTLGGEQEWLNLEQLADVEVTSEDAAYPVESVFDLNPGPGWRAAKTGQQTVRLLFSQPQAIHRIHLEFSESEVTRTQEFTLRWSGAADGSWREIVRQQWNFSPQGSNSQVEDYTVNLADVRMLELVLNPDVSGGGALASLRRWQVA